MGVPAFLEQRRMQRRHVTTLLPGTLLDAEQRVLQCKPVDISPEGLSILSGAVLPVGTALELKTHNASIAFEVIWQKPDFGKKGLVRYGLKACDPAVDLETLFRDAGCLKTL